MNKWRYGLILLVMEILQASVVSRIQIFGAVPNLTLVLVIAIAIIYGDLLGGYTGLGLGLLEDIIYANVLGVRALLYFLIGTAIGRSLHNTSGYRASSMFTVFLSSLIYNLAYYLIYLILRVPLADFSYFKGPVFIEGVVNAILYLLVLGILKKLLKPDSIKKYSGF